MLLPTFRLPAAVLFSAVFCTAVLPVHAQQDDPPLEIPPSRTQTNVPPAVVLDLFRAVPAAYAASPDLFREPDTGGRRALSGALSPQARRSVQALRPRGVRGGRHVLLLQPSGSPRSGTGSLSRRAAGLLSGRPVRHDRGDRHRRLFRRDRPDRRPRPARVRHRESLDFGPRRRRLCRLRPRLLPVRARIQPRSRGANASALGDPLRRAD